MRLDGGATDDIHDDLAELLLHYRASALARHARVQAVRVGGPALGASRSAPAHNIEQRCVDERFHACNMLSCLRPRSLLVRRYATAWLELLYLRR